LPANSLITETSPYLLQHAHNPVDWHAWNKETLALSQQLDKPILVSIGYSACHWCHVMEHESFEDEATAKIMNAYFINVKVDREERPDIDQVYMSAVQLMTGRGGWPLNCFIMPDGRPFYGGTYFPKQEWQTILLHLGELWKNDRGKVTDYADQLTEGIRRSEPGVPNRTKFQNSINRDEAEFSFDTLHTTVSNWKERLDNTEGGPNHAPKFPLPNNYQFLLRYAHLAADKEIEKHIALTLQKMAFGGIYDQIGGGFARYSTDLLWKVPHFEKMLYDNAQLISLYAEAFQASGNKLHKEVVYDTVHFIQRELCSEEGAFYSALDADTEGEEGKYYVWTKDELQSLLGDDYGLAVEYFNINEKGYWEHDNYILLRDKTDEDFLQHYAKSGNQLSPEQLEKKTTKIKNALLTTREKRTKPGLDDKILTSWNALMLQGLVDAYRVFDNPEFLELARRNANFILSKQLKPDASLWHSHKNGRSTINGFLEDYAFTIEAFISLYQCSFDETWLEQARKLMDYCIAHFLDAQTGLFYFTSDLDQALITRKTETSDNVIPASCSSIAKSLFTLGRFYGEIRYTELSKKMLHALLPNIPSYGAGYSNWCMLLLNLSSPFYEVAIVGKDVDEIRKELSKHYLPNVIFAGSPSASTLPLLLNRYSEDKTLIYVCENSSCKLPVETVEEALYILQRGL